MAALSQERDALAARVAALATGGRSALEDEWAALQVEKARQEGELQAQATRIQVRLSGPI